MSVLLKLRTAGPSGGGVVEPPPTPEPPADELVYPLTYTPRGSNRSVFQDDAITATDRLAVGMMDACHTIGLDSGDHADTTPPASNYLSRAAAVQEILDGSIDGQHHLFTYHNVTEAFVDKGTTRADKIQDYLETLDGPGSDDGYAYNSSGNKVLLFGNQYTINNSDYVAEKNGAVYPEWYATEIAQLEYLDIMAAAGIGLGAGGANIFLDNHQLHSNKSGIDWDNVTGGNDDAQDYYDTEEAAHVTADPIAVIAYSTSRANMRKAIETWDAANPGHVTLINTNQWATDPADRQSVVSDPSLLRNCILEYRLDGDENQAYVQGGLSENNSNEGFPRSGVTADGTNNGTSGTWEKSYCNVYQATRMVQFPKIVPIFFRIQCLQSGTTGDAGLKIYPNDPSSSAKFHMARWAMATAWLAGAHAGIAGRLVGNSASGSGNTTLWDEMGLINGSVNYNSFGSGNTKLYHKWMGVALEVPPLVPVADGSWQREFTNAMVILNPDNDETNDPISIDVSALPGGASEWTRFVGDQDNTINDGSDASSDFDMEPIDAIILARKSWYDAL